MSLLKIILAIRRKLTLIMFTLAMELLLALINIKLHLGVPIYSYNNNYAFIYIKNEVKSRDGTITVIGTSRRSNETRK